MFDSLSILSEAAGEVHVDPSALGLTATAWVSLAMLVFLGILLWKKVPAVIAASLDKKIAEIRAQLDEARQLRAEAEQLKAEYEAKMTAAEAEAGAMKAQAEAEAEVILADAKTHADQVVARRQQMAEDKIAAAERSAIADIKSRIAGAASAAAAALIAETHDGAADKPLVDATIGALGTRLN